MYLAHAGPWGFLCFFFFFNNSVKDALRENTFLLIFIFYPIPQTNGSGLHF